MKKHILLIALLFATFFTFGQTNQGDKLVGGTVSFGTQFVQDNNNQLFLNFNPNYGKFIVNNIAVGASIGLNFQKQNDNSSTSISLLPFGRYYVGNSDVLQFYGEVKGGYIYQRENNTFTTSNSQGAQFSIGPGVAFFLSENVSFDFLVNYQYVRLEEIRNRNLSFNLGFQVYLLGDQ